MAPLEQSHCNSASSFLSVQNCASAKTCVFRGTPTRSILIEIIVVKEDIGDEIDKGTDRLLAMKLYFAKNR